METSSIVCPVFIEGNGIYNRKYITYDDPEPSEVNISCWQLYAGEKGIQDISRHVLIINEKAFKSLFFSKSIQLDAFEMMCA